MQPIRNVAPPMSIKVTMNVYFIPFKSPNRPKKRAPKGRTTKPAANVAKVDSNAAVGLSAGKNLVDNTMERLPNIKKSYHSISVPKEEAPMTFHKVFFSCCIRVGRRLDCYKFLYFLPGREIRMPFISISNTIRANLLVGQSRWMAIS